MSLTAPRILLWHALWQFDKSATNGRGSARIAPEARRRRSGWRRWARISTSRHKGGARRLSIVRLLSIHRMPCPHNTATRAVGGGPTALAPRRRRWRNIEGKQGPGDPASRVRNYSTSGTILFALHVVHVHVGEGTRISYYLHVLNRPRASLAPRSHLDWRRIVQHAYAGGESCSTPTHDT